MPPFNFSVDNYSPCCVVLLIIVILGASKKTAKFEVLALVLGFVSCFTVSFGTKATEHRPSALCGEQFLSQLY